LSDLSSLAGTRDVILIGEIHLSLRSVREPLMKELGRGLHGRVCLFYELDREYTIGETMDNFSDPVFADYLAMFQTLHRAAKALMWKEMTVDAEVFNEEGNSVSEVNRRDRAMALKIRELMKRECDKAVMFVGKAHLVNESKKRVNLNQLLKQGKLKTLAINLQDPRDRFSQDWDSSTAQSSMSWNGVCPRGKKPFAIPRKPVIFLSRKLPAGVALFPKTRETSLWSAFDLTILAFDKN
jgi:hypothetical protein